MAKFSSGHCVHCGKFSQTLTGDHVFPQSWYPDTTTADLEKWQAPSCGTCNSELGKVERRLFQQLALGTDPWNAAFAGIGEKALRSIDPRAAKNEKDRIHREASRNRLHEKSIEVMTPAEAELPNVGRLDVPPEGAGAVNVSEDDLVRLVGKIVRGISFVRTGSVLPEGYIVRVVRLTELPKIGEEWLQTSLELFERPPGFRVYRHFVPDDPFLGFYRVFIWDRYEFAAFIALKSWPAKEPAQQSGRR